MQCRHRSPTLAACVVSSLLVPSVSAQWAPTAPTAFGAQATLEWTRRFDNAIQGHDNAGAVAVDSQGDVIVVGSSLAQYGPSYVYDTTTLKYAPDGTLLWQQRYHGPGSGFTSAPVDVAIDAADAIYVLANDPGSSGNQDILLIKYGADGQQQWLRRFDNNWSESAVGLVIDGAGDVYVAASSYYAGNVTDVVLLKYDPDGDSLWTRNWHGGFGTDWPIGLALDPHGNVDVVGNTIAVNAGTNFDWVVLEYDPAGNLLWTRKLAGALLAPDYSHAMAVAANGDVYATGYLVQTSGTQHHTTARWSDTGMPLWTHTFPTGTGAGKWIAFDAAGRAYVAGQAGVVAYSTTGGLRWQKPFSLTGAAWTTPLYVTALGAGRLAVGGSGRFGSNDQMGLVILDVAGHELDQFVVAPPDVAVPRDFARRGHTLYLHGSGTNGHDQDLLTSVVAVR